MVSLYLGGRNEKMATVNSRVNQLEINTLILFKNDNDYFDLETTNEEYFSSGQSSFLQRRDSLLHKISADLKMLLPKVERQTSSMQNVLLRIDTALLYYNQKFIALEKLVRRKGFKNFGLEGEMREHAHRLENMIDQENLTHLLNLRRHEKDFLLRQDTLYVAQFRDRAHLLRSVFEGRSNASRSMLFHLDRYEQQFLERVDIEKEIGLTSRHGLRHELNELTNLISVKYLTLSTHAQTLASESQRQARLIFSAVIISAILFSAVSGIWISRRLSKPIALLSKHMETSDLESAGDKINLDVKNAAIEVQTLSLAFNRLLEKSEVQLAEIKTKSKLVKKKNKELKRLNKELDSFLYSAAHDLRSPLSSLQGLFNLLGHEKEQKNMDAYLAMMRSSVDRMEAFISQIVSYTKNKRLDVEISHVHLKKLVTDIVDNHRYVEGAENLTWAVDVRETADAYTDANRLTTLLNNLVSNGIKYADFSKPNPFVRIEIRSETDFIIIRFIDNGVGIAEEHLGNIFQMFYRANASSKGSGLGLYIFKQTLRKLNGLVKVESVLGEGTKYFIQVPNQVQAMVPSLLQQQSQATTIGN
ncbi:MAG: sensor histidine kinase [Bacteroidota bacterium]